MRILIESSAYDRSIATKLILDAYGVTILDEIPESEYIEVAPAGSGGFAIRGEDRPEDWIEGFGAFKLKKLGNRVFINDGYNVIEIDPVSLRREDQIIYGMSYAYGLKGKTVGNAIKQLSNIVTDYSPPIYINVQTNDGDILDAGIIDTFDASEFAHLTVKVVRSRELPKDEYSQKAVEYTLVV